MGEFESQKMLMQHVPESIVPPIAWGRFRDDPTKAFYLTHFRYLHEQLPKHSQLLPIIKKLHQSSTSPTGKFGFPVTTFWGPPPMDNNWTDSWEEWFTRKFLAALEYGQQPHGKDEELCELGQEFIAKVIPRLLRPLQTGGRNIKPTLCHGDLCMYPSFLDWRPMLFPETRPCLHHIRLLERVLILPGDANVQIDASTGLAVLFDPCCFYGHNESENLCPVPLPSYEPHILTIRS